MVKPYINHQPGFLLWTIRSVVVSKYHPWDDPDADAADDAVAGLGFGYERLDPIQGPHAKPSGPGLQGPGKYHRGAMKKRRIWNISTC